MKHLASAIRSMIADGDLTVQQVKTWKAQALDKLATNAGQTIVNASAHGISFAAAGRVTWDIWFAVLNSVLTSLDRNTKLSGKAIASFY